MVTVTTRARSSRARRPAVCLLLAFCLVSADALGFRRAFARDDCCDPPDNGRAAAVQETPEEDLLSLTLEEMFDLSVEVVTRTKQPLRAAPGIVTVITREEIVKSGARDLIDVLALVPGLHFGMDNQNFVSLGVRGVWAQEGKILLVIDGQEFNEPYYSCLEFGNHFPIDQIERIEIIRGPGSVIYGGYAELGVINVVTRGADDFQGLSVQATYGQMAGTYGRRNLSALFARTLLKGDLKLSLGGFFGEGHRSDRTYRDFAGQQFDMQDDSALDPRWLNLGVEYRRLQVRLLYDGHQLGMEDGMDQIVPPVRGENTAYFAEARSSLEFGRAWTVIPRVQFRRSLPWRVTDAESPLFFDYTGDRYLLGIAAWYEPAKPLRFNAGVEWTRDCAKLNDERLVGLQAPLQDGKMEVDYESWAGFTQLLYEGQPANLTLGARYESHSEYGSSFVPRVALTRGFGPAHVKLLYARAFRNPSFLNISLGSGIKPEQTTVLEGEFGYQFGEHFYAGLNVFNQVIHRPIVYFSGGGDEGYRNFDQTGSRGAEVEARCMYRGGYLDLSYSYYTPAGYNEVDLYTVEGHSELLRAFPAHKIVLSGSLDVTDHLSLSPTAVFTSDRYANLRGHVELDEEGGETIVGETGNAGGILQVNLYALYRDLGLKGLDLGFGVFNLLDRKTDFLQPYNSAHAPLPGPSREFVLRLTYRFELSEK